MNVTWIDTNAIYHEIIAETDSPTRTQRYIEGLVTPWSQMMAMFGGGSDDPLSGAKAWNWLLPDDLTVPPDVLTQLENAGAWTRGERAMQTAAQQFAPYADHIPFETFTGWLVLGDPAKSDPIMRGYTGAVDWMQPRFVLQYDTATPENLRSLEGAVVHEMNHLVRLRQFPWDMSVTVGDYIIHEGVAESFAGQLYGEDALGHYVTEFDDAQLDTAKRIIGSALDSAGFNVIRSYIFGDHWAQKLDLPQFGVPDYGGYAIGYRVVQAYLREMGKTALEATFVPAQEIITESRFFA